MMETIATTARVIMRGKAGDTIDGRYEIVGEAGLGTFGRVVDCVDLKHPDRRRVALKVVEGIERYTESAAVEAEILRDVNATARANGEEGGRLCVQLFETFEFRGHYCLAFERAGTSLMTTSRAIAIDPSLEILSDASALQAHPSRTRQTQGTGGH